MKCKIVVPRSLLLLILFVVALKSSAQVVSPKDSVIVMFGDTRTNHEVHKLIVKDIMTFHPVAVFHTGDLVYNGKLTSDWNIFKSIMKPILDSSRFYPSFGNHEMHSETMTTDYKVPNNGKWYSVNIMNIHFTVLDNFSNFSVGSKQYKWLVADLKASSSSLFRVVVMHLTVYSSGPHKDKIKKIKRTLVPLFEKYGVSVVFSGHNHSYEKSFANNIYYITTAGGGAPLYDKVRTLPESQLYIKNYNFCTLKVKNKTLEIRALDTNMRVIDAVNIKK